MLSLDRDGRKAASELGGVGERWKDWRSAGGGRSRGRRGPDPRGMCGERGSVPVREACWSRMDLEPRK